MPAKKRVTAAEKRRAADAYHREATATLVLLTRLRGMVGEAFARMDRGLRPWPAEPSWRHDFEMAFAELQARVAASRVDLPVIAPPPPRRRVAVDPEPTFTDDQKREIMREFNAAISENLARPESIESLATPEGRRLAKKFRDFQESYARAELSEKIATEVAALLRDVEGLRDLSGGVVLSSLLGSAPPRGES